MYRNGTAINQPQPEGVAGRDRAVDIVWTETARFKERMCNEKPVSELIEFILYLRSVCDTYNFVVLFTLF